MANQFTSQREYKYLDGVFYQRCSTCGRWLTRDAFIKDNHAKFGIRTRCVDCHKPIQRIHHQNWYENNKEYSREYYKEYHKSNSIKRNEVRNDYAKSFNEEHGFDWDKFHHKTRYYVRMHKLKPTACPICGRVGDVEIHHPSYETFEMWSSVVFCCHYCHSAIHDGFMECPKPIELLECNRQ